MKKLFAMLLALIMALGCVGALAEDTQPDVFIPEGIKAQACVTVDHEFANNMAAMMFDGLDAKYVESILGILEGTTAEIAMGGETAAFALTANGQALCSLKGTMDEEGIVLTGDIFPHYAVKVKFEDIEKAVSSLTEGMPALDISEEQMQALMADLETYVDDLNAFVDSVSEGAQVSEDGNTVTLNITSHQLAALGDALIARLSADEVLRPYLDIIVGQANAQQTEGEPMTVEALLQQAKDAVAQLAASEDQVVAVLEVTNSEDGTRIVATVPGQAQVTVEAAANTVDVRVLASASGLGEGEDWDTLYNGLVTGSNYTDTAMLVHVEDNSTEEEDKAYASVQILNGGMDITVSSLSTVKGEGTPDYFAYIITGIDPNMTDGDVLQVECTAVYGEAPEAPVLEGLTVIDPFQAGEEETNALMNDLATYGLPALMANAVQAMPDEMAAVMELLMPAPEEPVIEEGETAPESGTVQ